MIESTSLFLSLSFVSAMAAWISGGSRWNSAAAALIGSLAAMVKVTTLAPFLIVAGLMMAPRTVGYFRSRNWPSLTKAWGEFIAIMVIVLIAAAVWVDYGDSLKKLNEFGKSITSDNLKEWNFGSVKQRIYVWNFVYGRAIPEAIGNQGLLVITIGLSLFAKNKTKLYAIGAMVSYLIPFMVFTNLHFVHDYYQYENAIFIIAAVSIILGGLPEEKKTYGLLVFVSIIIFQWITYFNGYHKYLIKDMTETSTVVIAGFLKDNTPKGSVVINFGNDWSSEVGYYSERKTIAVPGWATENQIREILENPNVYTGGLKVSALLFCNGSAGSKPVAEYLLENKAKEVNHMGNCDVIVNP